jgi:hypothetical protein
VEDTGRELRPMTRREKLDIGLPPRADILGLGIPQKSGGLCLKCQKKITPKIITKGHAGIVDWKRLEWTE